MQLNTNAHTSSAIIMLSVQKADVGGWGDDQGGQGRKGGHGGRKDVRARHLACSPDAAGATFLRTPYNLSSNISGHARLYATCFHAFLGAAPKHLCLGLPREAWTPNLTGVAKLSSRAPRYFSLH